MLRINSMSVWVLIHSVNGIHIGTLGIMENYIEELSLNPKYIDGRSCWKVRIISPIQVVQE